MNAELVNGIEADVAAAKAAVPTAAVIRLVNKGYIFGVFQNGTCMVSPEAPAAILRLKAEQPGLIEKLSRPSGRFKDQEVRLGPDASILTNRVCSVGGIASIHHVEVW